MYRFSYSETFKKKVDKLLLKDERLKKKIKKALQILATDPFYPSFKTHKSNTRHFGVKQSSWVTEDVRINWDFDKENISIILLLDIGKHSGARKVYK